MESPKAGQISKALCKWNPVELMKQKPDRFLSAPFQGGQSSAAGTKHPLSVFFLRGKEGFFLCILVRAMLFAKAGGGGQKSAFKFGLSVLAMQERLEGFELVPILMIHQQHLLTRLNLLELMRQPSSSKLVAPDQIISYLIRNPFSLFIQPLFIKHTFKKKITSVDKNNRNVQMSMLACEINQVYSVYI